MVYLGLGSNLGNKQVHIKQALMLIGERVGEIHLVSDCYETPSWGYTSPNKYLNVAVEVETSLNPDELLVATQEIERFIGRQHKTVNGDYHDREIDIDILLYNDLIKSTPYLVIPHPQLHHRAFVLQQMCEIAPHIIHPVQKKTITELYSDFLKKQ